MRDLLAVAGGGLLFTAVVGAPISLLTNDWPALDNYALGGGLALVGEALTAWLFYRHHARDARTGPSTGPTGTAP